MASLRQFLQRGKLGSISSGMSEADVYAVLGPPQDVSVARHPYILKYGGLQLTFLSQAEDSDRRLAHIGLYFGPYAEPISESVLPADFHATPETTLDEVREFLAEAGIQASFVVEGDDTSYLILPSGARITFDGRKLHSIHFAARAPRPATKQISVSIPKETWNQLKTLARQSNRSVSQLCAEWITQQAKEHQHDNVAGVS